MANEMADLRDRSAEPSSEDRLNSWKEIAAYLKCSERTVRRWEQEGMPVHRHVHKSRAAIYAYKAEVNAWWREGHERLKQLENLEEQHHTATNLRRWRTWLVAGTVLTAALVTALWLDVGGLRERMAGRAPNARIQSLAVLPLINLSGNPDQEYFADGMTEELISQLAQISALKVISRASVMHYKGTKESSPQIARALAADALIEGSIRREGDRVEIAVQLIEGQSDRHLWAKEYQREIHGVLALQGSVASAIADEVNAKLTPGERAHLQQARAVDPDAYEAYLKGRYFFERWNADGRMKAVAYFQQAIAKDRGFAAAYSGLADTLTARNYFGESTRPDERANGIAAAQEAVTLDGSLAESHASVGFLLLQDLHWADAERELQSSVSLNPNCSTCHIWYAYYLTFVRRFPDAAQEMNKAQALDPLSSMTYVTAAVMRYFSRDFDEAARQYQKAIELDQSNPEAYKNLADVYLEGQNCSEATRLFVRSEELVGHFQNASALARAFRISGCRGMLSKQLEFYSDPANPDYYPMYAASNAALLGKKEEAFKFLEKAYETRRGIVELPVEPELDNIRSDARYPDLLRRMSFPVDSATVPTAPNQPR